MNSNKPTKRRLEIHREDEERPNLSMARPLGEKKDPAPRLQPQANPIQPLERPKWAQRKDEEEEVELPPLSHQEWQEELTRLRRSRSNDNSGSTNRSYRPEVTRAERARTHRRSERATRRATPFQLSCTFLLILSLCGFLGLYFFFPETSMILVLGLDRSIEENGWLSRSDTIMVTQVHVMQGEVNMLSIPRDLWVGIPGYGENRINTAHYFGEVYNPGTGAQSAIDTVQANFGVKIKHYVRIKLEEFPRLINAMGGITVTLAEPMGGLEAGTHKLDGTEALKFVRDRSGTDDFYRMRQGQTFLKAVINRLLSPGAWLRTPLIFGTAMDMIDTDIPAWQWSRYAFTLMRAYPDKINATTLTRDQATPYITDQGANVLLPNWDAIYLLVDEVFR